MVRQRRDASGRPINAAVWSAIQDGLAAMLVSPADKRRVGIEVKPVGNDADADAAILTIAKYQEKLR